MSLPYNRASMQLLKLSEIDSIQQMNKSPGQVNLHYQMDQSIDNLFAFQPPQPIYSMDMNVAQGDNELDWSAGSGNLYEHGYGPVSQDCQMDSAHYFQDMFVPTQLTYSEYMNMADDDNEFYWSSGFVNLFQEGYALQDHHRDGSTNRQEEEWTREQIQNSTVRSITTLNSNASTEDHLLSFGNELDLEMFYQVNRDNLIGSWQSEVTNTPPFMENYNQGQCNSFEDVGGMESYKSEVTDTRSTIEPNDHVQVNLSESMAMEQMKSDTTNLTEATTNGCTVSPIVKNLRLWNFHLQCRHCEQSFYSKSELDSHLPKHSAERPFRCDKCGKRFVLKRHLSKHQLSHQDKSYRCDDCDQQFAFKCNYDLHVRRHSNVRPYKCKQCEWSFCDMTSMKRHFKSTHLRIRPYRCTLCVKLSFATKSNTISHIRVVHFGLPKSVRVQRARNIIDHRDPNVFIRKCNI